MGRVTLKNRRQIILPVSLLFLQGMPKDVSEEVKSCTGRLPKGSLNIAYSIHVFPCARVSGTGVTTYTVAFGIYTNLLKKSPRLVPIFFAKRTTKETKNHFYGSQLVTNHFHDSHLHIEYFHDSYLYIKPFQ